MPILTPTDWKAIKWFMGEFNYTIKDMIAGPVIRFRNSKNEKIDVNIFDIKTKYNGKVKKTKKSAA